MDRVPAYEAVDEGSTPPLRTIVDMKLSGESGLHEPRIRNQKFLIDFYKKICYNIYVR